MSSKNILQNEYVEASIVGGGGFTGRELLRILSDHPFVRPVYISSDKYAGTRASDCFPELDGKTDLVFKEHKSEVPENSVVFLATPNEVSLEMVPSLLEKGHRVIDLSGIYRLQNIGEIKKYYGIEHTSIELCREAVYGMPELFREKIKNARLISNPGCFPTGSVIILNFLGRLREEISSVIIDAKSGVSGAGGRTEDAGLSFYGVYENFRAYKILRHQHFPEIQMYSSQGLAEPLDIVFTPHLLPLFRGILSTIVVLWEKTAPGNLREIFQDCIKDEPFVRLLEEPEQVQLSRVQNTNYLDFSFRSEGRKTVIVSALDNLVKGAAGQAVHNLNIALGFPENAGLI